MIRCFEDRQVLRGFRFHPVGVSITHLFYAHDSALFCNTGKQEARYLKYILECYEKGWG